MRLKAKPSKPKRAVNRTKDIAVKTHDTLAEILECVKGKDLSECVFHITADHDYDDYYTPAVVISVPNPETDSEFYLRVVKYKRRLKEWNTWYKENEIEIKAELKKREERVLANTEKKVKEAEKILKQKKKRLEAHKKRYTKGN